MATVVEIIPAVMAVATAVEIIPAVMAQEVILNLITLIQTNLQGQKVGKIEVMEILLKTPNMKVVGVGEKEEFPIKVMLLTKKTSNPFL